MAVPRSKVDIGQGLYCSRRCRWLDPVSKVPSAKCFARQASRKAPTIIEQLGYAVLTELGVAFDKQCHIGTNVVDAFVPSIGLVIQFDGNFWHGNPDMYPTPNEYQKKRQLNDAACDARMRERGYSVLRLWESDMMNNMDHVFEVIRERTKNAARR